MLARLAAMVRLLRIWFSPLQVFNRGIWNVLLNLGGTLLVGAIAWLAARLYSSAVGIVTGLALVLLILLVVALTALWTALPKQALTLSFNGADVQMVKSVNPVTGQVLGDARYFHFKVSSKAKVQNCRGRLVRLEAEVPGVGGYQVVPQFKPPENLTLDSVQGLRWPEIEPDLPARINLVFSESTRAGALLAVEDHSPHGNLTSLNPGKYRLTVRVSADGVEDVDERFIVHVTGMWSGLQVALQ
jgi:hypothetical protein